jgi:hypothetical protein
MPACSSIFVARVALDITSPAAGCRQSTWYNMVDLVQASSGD